MNKDYNTPYIYESPDNGKTVYRRRFGDHTDRELIQSPSAEQSRDAGIWSHCAKVAADGIEWDKQEHEQWLVGA